MLGFAYPPALLLMLAVVGLLLIIFQLSLTISHNSDHLKVLTPNGRVRMVQEDPQDQRRDSGSGNRQDRGRQNRSKDRDQRNNQEPEPRNGGPDKDDNPDSQP